MGFHVTHAVLMKALKCKMLGASPCHYNKRLLHMTTVYLLLTLVGKGRQTNLPRSSQRFEHVCNEIPCNILDPSHVCT